MKYRIDVKALSAKIGFTLFCIVSMFGELMVQLVGENIRYVIWVVSLFLIIYACCENSKVWINKKVVSCLFPWLLMTVIYVLIYNRSVYKLNLYTTLRWLYFFSFMYFLSAIDSKNYSSFIEILKKLSFVYVLGVYFFILFPDKYNVMYKIWGYWPTGTNNGFSGFHAGFANHYSENAMYIIPSVFIIVSQMMTSDSQRKKRTYFIDLLITGFALIATAKRAHVLFGTIALIGTYYFFEPEKRMSRGFKILIVTIIILVILYILTSYIPVLNSLFERFSNIGIDQESNTRFSMWELALENFKKSPMFGIGWSGFKYEFNKVLYNPLMRAERFAYLNAHNVYIQLLCETGIMGFLIALKGAMNILRRTFYFLDKSVRDLMGNKLKTIVFFSLAMQIFFWLYSITGNCLYDTMFSFYSIAVGMIMGCMIHMKNCGKEIKQ
ncbi:O-antigen ligase family protein [Holdemania filiformis]|uniref:O-antigen ligase family protein n=1 Tax=Holdemania filiformis TaxID=61171 RepID=UPI0026769EBC|nr:O-antigen ligase family protein [Holdemania filiformis]